MFALLGSHARTNVHSYGSESEENTEVKTHRDCHRDVDTHGHRVKDTCEHSDSKNKLQIYIYIVYYNEMDDTSINANMYKDASPKLR